MTPPDGRCACCGISAAFPGIVFNDQGVCQHCQDAAVREVEAAEGRKVLEDVLTQQRGTGTYDTIVAFSGGKDSSYLLWLLRQRYDMRILAITVDNGFVSDKAFENCRTVVNALGVDYQIYRPASSFMSSMYRNSINSPPTVPSAVARASAVCSSCINLINTYVVKEALRHNAAIVAGGYLTGQLPRGGGVMKLSVDTVRRAREMSLAKTDATLGKGSRDYLALPEEFAGRSLWLANPLALIDYSEEEVLKTIATIGWERPVDTGLHSSNCQLNDLGIHSHLKRFGFHPYEGELTEQVRTGSMSREEAIRRLEKMPDESVVRPIADKLGLDFDQL